MLSGGWQRVRHEPPGGGKPSRGGPKWLPEGIRRALGRQVGTMRPPNPLGSRIWAALGAFLGRSWRVLVRLGDFWAAPGAS